MTSVDARILGTSATIRGVSSWLGDTLAPVATDADTTGRRQRDLAAESWSGDASQAAQGRISTVASRTGTLGQIAGSTAQALDLLAAALDDEQAEMARAIAVASAAGLRVDGTVITAPSPALAVAALSPDATPAEAETYRREMAAHDRAVARSDSWEEVVGIVDGALARWGQALADASATWDANAGNLVGLTNDLLSTGVKVAALAAVSRFAASGAQMHAAEAAKLAQHVDELAPDGRVRTSSSHWYDLYDRMRVESGLADDAARAGANARVPVALGRGLVVLGVAAAGYGIYDDMQNGESTEQAVASNAAGFGASVLAGMGAGAATGAIVGSFIPVPVVGTVAGAVVGTVVGTAAGIITSGAIDSIYENGVDSIGDVGNAIADGWDELTGTVGDAGELIGDAAGAVGDTVKDAWNAIF